MFPGVKKGSIGNIWVKCLSLFQLNVSNHNLEEGSTTLASNSKLLVYPCCYSNDRTALKPTVELNPVTKRNVDLTVPVGLNFVKEHNPPDQQMLKELIVTEAVAGSFTSHNNKVSLPVSSRIKCRYQSLSENP